VVDVFTAPPTIYSADDKSFHRSNSPILNFSNQLPDKFFILAPWLKTIPL